MTELRLENVSKTYGNGTVALRDISLAIESGEFVVVLGKSGSGKSTLLRCINRLVEPSTGRIFFGDREITTASTRTLRAIRRKIGMIFQEGFLVPRTTVLTNVLTGRLGATSIWASLLNLFSADEVQAALRNLDRLGIADKAWDKVESLSGGQKQRVGIARAMMQKPDILLADEPVSSLDPATSHSILTALSEINRRDGVTLLCNLHIPELARQFGRRVLALKAGRLVYDGPPDGLDSATLQEFYDLKETP